MHWYYIKSVFRNIEKNKRFTLINIAGFAFGISICLAIALFLIKEYSFDRYNKNADQIVRLIDTKNNTSQADYRVKDMLLNNFPEFNRGCLVQRINHPIEIKTGDQGFYLDNIMSVDNDFFDVFSVKFISGKPESPFTNNQSAVITESTAKKLFGSEDPLGKELLLHNQIPATITSVIADFPDNSSISAGLLVNAENDEFKFSVSMENSEDLSTYRWPFTVYLQLKQNTNPEILKAKINSGLDKLQPYIEEGISFLPLKDIHLYDTTTGGNTKQGNVDLLRLLTAIALIILALAIINYINLTIAQKTRRNKDTGIKLTIGASKKSVIYHFLFESLIITFLSLGLALIFVQLMLPFYQSVFETKIDLQSVLQFPNILLLIGMILLVGLISGIGPAIVLSRVNPVQILSGSIVTQGKKGHVGNILTIFQFTVSIILIFCVVVVQRQIHFVKHVNPGFNKEQLLRIDIPGIRENDTKNTELLLSELRRSPYIKNLSVSNGTPGNISWNMGSNMENSDKNMSVPCLFVDTAFVNTFDLKVIRGRSLSPGDFGKVCLMNEAAYKHFEFDNLENKRFNNFIPGGFEIIGVVNDFNYSSLHESIGPVCILFTDKITPNAINIRFAQSDVGPGMQFLNDTWKKILPGYPLKYQFYDVWFDSLYHMEERFGETIGLFAVLAIVISCMGILGLAIFSSERRIKEIGIRKVNGAKIGEILTMLNKDFVKWVVIAFLIATPIAWYAMNKWLENFAYKTELSWWIFALAGLLALGIALLTVSWQSWKAATRNPVEALRYE